MNVTNDTHSIGDAMLEVFRAYGVEYIFSSPGSEWAPLWETVAKAKAMGLGPTFINTRHEELAASAAVGHYRHTRKLPILALHTTAGTLKASMVLRAALVERVPMVVLAGESAGYGEMVGPDPGSQWLGKLSQVGGPATQASPYVKRSTSVPSREILLGMLQDACRLALTAPMGPVFLSVPLEFLFGEHPPVKGVLTPPPNALQADPADLELVAQQLVRAERPVVLTERAGKDPQNVPLLVELAEKLSMPVLEFRHPAFMNFPRDHALHLGFNPQDLLATADLILLVGCDNPWYPASTRPAQATVVAIDDDPSHEHYPYWPLGLDRIVAGDMTASLAQLNKLVDQAEAAADRGEGFYAERRAYYQEKHTQLRSKWRADAEAAMSSNVLNGRSAAMAIGNATPADAFLVAETITHSDLLMQYIQHSLPGTRYSGMAGGLGVGLGTALGLKLAAPERLVLAVVGDGAFNYNPVVAAFGFVQQFDTPIIVIIMDNQRYAAMKQAHLRYYPDGHAVRTGVFVGTEIEPKPDYAVLAQAFGGYGETVERAQDLPGALQRAIEHVGRGELVVLDVVVE